MGRILAGLAVVLTGLCSGCGSSSPAAPSSAVAIDSLPGSRVGRLAEEQLEAEHDAMAVGSVTCPDLPWKVDASVRCVKVSELSGGRRVTVPGTVTVTSTRGWGRLHVELDDAVTEFGVTAEQLEGDVAAWVAQHGGRAEHVRCPYLRGVSGAVARCAVTMSGREQAVVVKVTGVQAREYRTSYALSWTKVPAARPGKGCLRCG